MQSFENFNDGIGSLAELSMEYSNWLNDDATSSSQVELQRDEAQWASATYGT